MSKTAWIIFGAVIVALLGGLVIYSQMSSPRIDLSSVDTNAIIAANDQNGQVADHVLGNEESKVILIEYGDFQCPSCAGAHPKIKSIAEEYDDRIAFVFRNFPLTAIHPNAKAAAGAAEAAGLQGKYWEMHDLLFENQNEWGNLDGTQRTDRFAQYAEDLGLDRNRFLTDLAEKAVDKKLSFDMAIAKKLNVAATPTFYLNGEKLGDEISNSIVQGDAELLKEALDRALEE